MLVLARREAEKVLFPTLGISIEILQIRGHTARLGIDAPSEIPVLRHEVSKRKSVELTHEHEVTREQLLELAHTVRRRLNIAATALNELHTKLERAGDASGQRIVLQLYRDLQELELDAHHILDWSSSPTTPHVLLVQACDLEHKLLATVLELSGFLVTTANGGQQALEFLSMHARPDIVLVDLRMPHGCGARLVRQVRSDSSCNRLKIFAISRVDPGTLGVVTGQGGIDGWFSDACEPGELVSALTQSQRKSTAA